MQRLSPPTSIPEKPAFIGFNGGDVWQVPGYTRNLPHWRVEGATYFVTFRLAGSIPESVVRRWQDEDSRWFKCYGIEHMWQERKPDRFRTALLAVPREERLAHERKLVRRFLVELDHCHGACILRSSEARQIVAGALRFFHSQRVWLGDFVIMPNHVHLLALPFPGVNLEDWLYSVKRFSGTRLGPAGKVWQEESFDRVVRDELELARVREYIARNPAKMREGSFTLERATWIDEFVSM
jgi:type I restriction enzyme R subunit